MGFSRSACCSQPSLGNPTGVEQEHQALFLPFAYQYPSLVRKSCPRENKSRVFDLIPKYPSLGTSDAQAPSEASHVEPCLFGVNMTIFFPRALENRHAILTCWDAWTNLIKPQITTHRPSHGLLAHAHYSSAKHHKHNSRVSSQSGRQQIC